MDREFKDHSVCQIVFSGYGGHTDLAISLYKNFHRKFGKLFFLFYGYEKIPLNYINFCKKKNIAYYKVSSGSFFLKNWVIFFFALIKTNCSLIILHTGTIFPVAFYKIIKKAQVISVYHQSIFLKSKKDKIIEYIQYRLSNFNIVITKKYFSHFVKKYKFSKNLYLIPNGIELNKFINKKKKINPKNIKFGMASRFIKSKRHVLLLNCFKNLPKNITLHLAGSGEDEKCLRIYVKKNKIKNVFFNGYVEQEKMRNWFQKIDFYIHISDGETMSLSIMQAMASGKVILASNVLGINNIIKNKQNGYLTKNNKQTITDIINKIVLNNKKNLLISENAITFAEKNFNINNTYKLYLGVIKKAIYEKNSS